MRKIFLVLSMLITASFVFTACEPAGNTYTANKTANVTNSANNATATAPANAAAIEAEIKKLMNDAAASLAKNDAAAMEKIYADNYVLVNLDGSVETRAQRLESLKSGTAKYESFGYDEVSVRSNPEGTGAVSIARATIKATLRGKATDGTFRVTHVYSKTKDGWKQVSAHATPITGTGTTPASNTANTAPANR